MGDYTARKWKAAERARNFVEITNNEKQVVKPSLRFDKNGKLMRE